MNDMPAPARLSAAASAVRRRVRLLGQPHLEDYIDFVQEKTVDGATANVRALADEWRTANDYYYKLEQKEAGIADEVETLELDPALAPLVEALRSDPRFIADFDALPTTIELVELDRLIVCQQSVSLDFVEDLRARLPQNPSPEQLFRFCQPLERVEAPVEIRKLDENRYQFVSESSDFRPHDLALLRADQVTGLASHDPVSAVLALAVGFGSNILHAIRVDDRLILHNGYHRAYALRDFGLTHAVCVVQEVTRRDELKLVGADLVVEAPEFYCRAARPPLLKDFFDPKIRKLLNVRKMSRLIEVKLDVREFQIVD